MHWMEDAMSEKQQSSPVAGSLPLAKGRPDASTV
jgi:hypothetical protein